MKICIWCRKNEREETFNKQAHTIPQSLGGKQICINVCDKCNAFFGARQKNKVPAIETCLKEALAMARFHFVNSSKRVKLDDYVWIKPGIKEPKFVYQPGNYTSEYFEVDFDNYKFSVKPQFRANPKLPSIITRQFKRALYKVFLEETERQRHNGLESRFDFIRDFARNDKGDLPVLHFERNSGRFFYIDELIVHPRLFFNKEGEQGYYKEEYGFFEFELIGHVFAIATSSLWQLNFDTYVRKTLSDKAQDFSDIRVVESFDDLDLFFQRANSKPWDTGLNIPVEGQGFFAAIVKLKDSYIARSGDIASRNAFHKQVAQERSKIKAYAEGVTVEDARTKAQELLFSSSEDQNERIGLQFHFKDTVELKRRIATFSALDTRTLSDEDIVDQLRFIVDPGDFVSIKFKNRNFIYRGRKSKSFQDFPEDEADVWAPPTFFTDNKNNIIRLPVGRLNMEGESLLYTSTIPTIIPSELGLSTGDVYYLIRYRLRSEKFLRLILIGLTEEDLLKLSIRPRNKSTWTSQAKVNYELVMEFIHKLFVQQVKQDESYIHRITALLTREYLDIPEIDGFLYPSVNHRGGFNIAIKSHIEKELLEYMGLRLFRYLGNNENEIMVQGHLQQSDYILDGKIQYRVGYEWETGSVVDF